MRFDEANFDNHINLVGIDPGSNFLGLANFKINLDDLSIVSIDTISLNVNMYNLDYEQDNNLTVRMFELEKALTKALGYFDPLLLTFESGYINPKMPAAFLALARAQQIIYHSARKINPHLSIHTIPPSVVKNAVDAGGIDGKDKITVAVGRIPELKDKVNLYGLTEHEVDAIAITYAMLTTLRTDGGFLLCSAIL